MKSGLKDYQSKRKFTQTPEPKGATEIKESKTQADAGESLDPDREGGLLRFCVQLHRATRLHYDFRIEIDGVLKSWAVPKGPSLDPQDRALAVQVEDHPLEYGEFEGIIPKGNYGAGTVMLWDKGTLVERGSSGRGDSQLALQKGLEKGHLTFILDGSKLQGEFALIRLKPKGGENSSNWILVKKQDAHSSRKGDVKALDCSAKTGRTMDEIASEAPSHQEIWDSRDSKSAEQMRTLGRKRIDASRIPSAHFASHSTGPYELKREHFPHQIKPMLPVEGGDLPSELKSNPDSEPDWLFEPVFSGVRVFVEKTSGRVRVLSRQHLPLDAKFPWIAGELIKFKGDLLLDGEVVSSDDGGLSLWVRDLLHLRGESLRELPLIERKRRLWELDLFGGRIHGVPDQGDFRKEGSLPTLYPGILARHKNSLYVSGVSRAWLKFKVGDSLAISAKGSDSGTSGSTLAHRHLITHGDKLVFPQEKITKRILSDYYDQVAPWLVPHLLDRPESLHRFPNGIEKESFFHKDMVGYLPRFASTWPVSSEHASKVIQYLLCQNRETLLYMVNLGCVEINPWLSRTKHLDRPDFIVIDLDPDGNPMAEVVEVAQSVRETLADLGAHSYCKTSGSTGLHIYLPVFGQCSFEEGREFALGVCERVHRRFKTLTSLERSPNKRKGKIYLDCFQNAQGQTVASIYSVRPRPGAPVSMPLNWDEVKSTFKMSDYSIWNVPLLLKERGDLWAPVLSTAMDFRASCDALGQLR